MNKPHTAETLAVTLEDEDNPILGPEGQKPIGALLMQSCHPGAGFMLAWEKADNILLAFCCGCGREVSRFAIAEYRGH